MRQHFLLYCVHTFGVIYYKEVGVFGSTISLLISAGNGRGGESIYGGYFEGNGNIK